ncbi:hypothetical protein [Streptomyces sp. NPDC048603]|uniref:hypothetical protein n=1 Tax=Streptomyces sp. NPDC048603 TaxID=3365577 RepID=UPI00371F0D87
MPVATRPSSMTNLDIPSPAVFHDQESGKSLPVFLARRWMIIHAADDHPSKPAPTIQTP